jgi:tRNA 2-thiocytidine biosynthesis protein TtcA
MAEFIKPSKTLARLAGRAIADFSMIRAGDRILLGLSGGKDSLSLLHILHYLQQRAPVRFELAAMTVDPMAGDFDPSPMIPYLADLGVAYYYVRKPIMEMAQAHMGRKSYCAFCSRLKRGLMYQTAREHGGKLPDVGFSRGAAADHEGALPERRWRPAHHPAAGVRARAHDA